MEWVKDEAIRLWCPDFTGAFVGRKTPERLEPTDKFIGCHKFGEEGKPPSSPIPPSANRPLRSLPLNSLKWAISFAKRAKVNQWH